MLGKERVNEILSAAIREISRRGLDGEALCHVSEEQTIRSAWSQIHQSPLARSSEIKICIRDGNKSASVSVGSLDTTSIKSAVLRATTLMAVAPENPYLNDLAPQPVHLPELNIPPPDEETASHAHELKVNALIKAHKENETIDCKASGRFFTGLSEVGVANTNGLLRYMSFAGSSFSLTVTGENHLSSFAKRSNTRISEIAVNEVISEAMERASLAKELPPYDPFSDPNDSLKNFDVLIHPYAMNEWLAYIAALGFNGLMVHEKQSFLSDKMDELITGKNITIRDDWTHQGLISIPFDFEGVDRNKVAFIENGVVKGAAYDGSIAKKAGIKSSGHSLKSSYGAVPLHLVFEGGDCSEQDLIESCDRPTIYITYFNYPGMPDSREAVFTATTRHGTFLIEGGQFKKVLPPLRFKEKTAEALSRVQGMSPPLILFEEENYDAFFPQSISAPFVKIENCSFIGSTKYN